MLNPFKVKCTKFLLSCSGHKRSFKVITADGKEYFTSREDYIGWGYPCDVALHTIKAEDLLSCRDGIQVDGNEADIRVKPITVVLLERKAVIITKEVEVYWLVFRPTKPKQSLSKGITYEVIADE